MVRLVADEAGCSTGALVHYFDESITAGQLDAWSDALAVALQERGAEPGERIAMYLQNIPQVFIAVLAAWKCGAVIVPCNPMLRERELIKILVDSGSRDGWHFGLGVEQNFGSMFYGKLEYTYTIYSDIDFVNPDFRVTLDSNRSQFMASKLT